MADHDTADKALKRNDFQAAERLYREMISQGKSSPATHYGHAAALLGCKREKEARALIEKGKQLHPGHIPPYDIFSNILKYNGNHDASLKFLQAMCDACPDQVGYHIRYGENLMQLERLQEADEWFEKIKNAFPNSGPHGYHILIALERGDCPQAIKRYEYAKGRLEAKLAEACLSLVSTNLTLRGVRNIVEWLDTSDPDFGNDPALGILIGKSLKKANMVDKALAVFKKIRETHPQYSAGYLGYVEILLDLWRLDEARKESMDAAKRFPDDWRLHMALARLTESPTDYSATAHLLEKEIQSSDNIYLYNDLGRAQMASGDEPAALQSFKTLHKLLYHQEDQDAFIDVSNMTKRRYAPTEVMINAIRRLRETEAERSSREHYCYVLAGASRAGGSYFAQVLQEHFHAGPYLPYVSDMAMFGYPRGAIFVSHSPYPPSPSYYNHGDVPLYHGRADVKKIFAYRHPIDNILSLWTSNFKIEHGDISDFIASRNTPFDEFLEQNCRDFVEYTSSSKYHNITWPVLVEQMQRFLEDPDFHHAKLEDFYDEARKGEWSALLAHMGYNDREIGRLDVDSVPAPRTAKYRYRSLMHIPAFSDWVSGIDEATRTLIHGMGYEI